jgi:uncharacterized protein (TIGR02466 family)
MSTIEIFPRVVGRYKLENSKHINLKNQCTELLSSIEEQYIKRNAENSNLTHYYNTSNQNLLSLEQFKWFEKWIEEKSINYIENTLGYYLKDGVIITDCWINNCNSGGEQFYHTHSNSYISGTYYVNFIKGLHSPLSFKNKDFNPENSCLQYFEIPLYESTKYNTSGAVIDHDEGDLLLWQSNMSHGYTQNNQDNRISISFNVMPRYLNNKSYSFRIERDETN